MQPAELPAVSLEELSPRQRRIQDILNAAAQTLTRGGTLDIATLVARHSDLQPDLEHDLKLMSMSHRQMLAAQASRRVPPLEDAAAIVVPNYRLERQIGRGGQGAVFRGVHKTSGQEAAIKILFGGPLVNRQRQVRLEREVTILASLRHRNIVGVRDYGRTEDGSLYIAMDYIDGQELDIWVARCRTLLDHSPEYFRRVIDLFEKVIAAVAQAHADYIVHRDLKPTNIRVNTDSEPFLLDFGLARVLDEVKPSPLDSRNLATEGSVMGSLSWLSPEQAAGTNREVGAPSDVYSLGVMLYEALTSRRPYSATSTLGEALLAIQRDVPTRPSQIEPRSPVQFDAVVMKALEKDPARRFSDAGEFLATLQAARTSAAKIPGRFSRKRWPVAAAMGLVVATAAALAAMRLSGDNGGKTHVSPAPGARPHAIPSSTSAGRPVISVSPSDDAFVRNGGSGDTPHGAEDFNLNSSYTRLEVKRVQEDGYNRDSYLRFPLRLVPPGRQVSRATLFLYGSAVVGRYSPANAYDGVLISVHRLKDPASTWKEQTITWRSRPLLSGWYSIDLAVTSTNVLVGPNRWYEFDLTSVVRESLKDGRKDFSVGLHVVDNQDVHAQFTSSETEQPPRLDIELAP